MLARTVPYLILSTQLGHVLVITRVDGVERPVRICRKAWACLGEYHDKVL